MKKYIFRYCFIIGIIVILYLLKNNQPTLLIGEFDDYIDKGIIDGYIGAYFLLIANVCFAVVLSFATITTTMQKSNIIKFKYLIASIIILSLFFVLPMVRLNYFGGIDGGNGVEYLSIFKYILYLFQ